MLEADHQDQKQSLQATTVFDPLLSLQASQAQNHGVCRPGTACVKENSMGKSPFAKKIV